MSESSSSDRGMRGREMVEVEAVVGMEAGPE
jgi:hypothetical protein